MPDPVCPRCGVPLNDRPDYCWSCGYFVGDRWRNVRLDDGSAPAQGSASGQVIDGTTSRDDLRVVSGIGPSGSAGLVVVLALVAVLALAGGRVGAPAGSATDGPAGGSVAAAAAGTSTGAAAPSTPHGTPALVAPLVPAGATTPATVTRVVDGDTINVDIDGTSYRVR